MAQPFNYSLGVPSPIESGQSAYQTELQGLNVQAQMQAAQAQAIAAQQKAQQDALRQQQWQEVTNRILSPNATASDYQRAMLLGNKDQADAIRGMFTQRTEEQNAAARSKLAPVVFALSANKPESAISVLERQKQAHSDNPDALQEIDSQIAIIKADPQAAQLQLGGALSLIPGGDKVLENALKLTQERRNVSREAREQSKELRDAEMQGWNIKKIQNDIGVSRMNAQIAAANAAASREGNTLKQQELLLKVQELADKRDQAVKTRIAEGESVVSSLQNTKALLSDILSKENRSALQTAVGSSAFLAMAPGTQARTIAGKIEQLQNAVAAVNLDKLKGAMSDKDILFLKNIESNLDRYQDEAAFIRELNRISNSLDQGISRAATKYGMPEPQSQTMLGQAQPQSKPPGRNVTVDF